MSSGRRDARAPAMISLQLVARPIRTAEKSAWLTAWQAGAQQAAPLPRRSPESARRDELGRGKRRLDRFVGGHLAATKATASRRTPYCPSLIA